MPTLIEHVQDYLIAEGLGRDPATPEGATPPAQLPTIWLDPKLGTPAPGEKFGDAVEANPDLVVGLIEVMGIAPRRHEGFMRLDHVHVRIRARKDPFAREWEQLLRDALNDKRDWTMAGLQVNESLLFRPMGKLGSGPQGYDYSTEYQFTLWQPPSPGP